MIAKKIFDWKCFTDWRVEIENLFPEILSPRIRAKVSECPDKIQYVDDQTYIYSLIKELQIQFSIPDEFARRFANNYSHIRTYHLCRPMDISTYQDKGLLVLSAGEIQALFKSLFLNSDYPELTQKDIDSAISEVGTKTRDGVLYLGLDDRFLMEYCGHYLVYGSEYLLALSTNLPIEKEKCTSLLRSKGTPTVFVLDLPIDFVEADTLCELWYEILPQWAYNIAHSHNHTVELDFGFTINRDIPANYLTGYYQPDKIKDPGVGLFDVCTGQYIE